MSDALNNIIIVLTAAKGNSIFAEVEDKRQEMAENLIHMKQNNSEVIISQLWEDCTHILIYT